VPVVNVSGALRDAGLPCVTDDVAVIGVNNSALICEFCRPAISSVVRDGYRIGFQAATLLDRLMSGRRVRQRDIRLAPLGVFKRGSTDVLAIEDPHVAAAVRFIREHACEPFGLNRLAQLVPISRRWLEHRFRQCLGRSPYEFVCRTRVERAKQLLAGPEKLKLKQIAVACGFRDSMRLRLVFRRLTGLTPAEYRASHRQKR